MAKHFSLREFQQGLSARLHKRWRMFVCGRHQAGRALQHRGFLRLQGRRTDHAGPDPRVLLVGQKLVANYGILVNCIIGMRRNEQLQRVEGVAPAVGGSRIHRRRGPALEGIAITQTGVTFGFPANRGLKALNTEIRSGPMGRVRAK